ncbi:MAG: U32 family peptidase [Euryarchaeota archaeon]|nr:U32 family peptidase [Euryarchaeota archaeon]MDE1835384.1 U32 family peptidase [Euryarchaeota archaeon]MDE2043680.1 U32 family peptidase [Thermoplasmata archaeon]
MELVLATNFDDRLVERVRELPVTTFFGGFPTSLTGGGRPPYILPSVTEDRFAEHLEVIHRRDRRFFATLNTNDLGLKEYEPDFLDRFRAEANYLLDLGVDGFVVAIPLLLEILRSDHPHVPVSASTFARLRTVNQAMYFRRMGAEHVILEEGNRDFQLIRGLTKAKVPVEVLVNQTCIRDCPYRAHHLNTSSLCSQEGSSPIWFEHPILQCGLEVIRDPTKLVSSIWVRPEDLAVYEEAGVHRFKISGRNRSTDWLVKVAQAYTSRKYEGNLLDILSFVQVKAPSQALEVAARGPSPTPKDVEALQKAFRPLQDVRIDNQAFPPGFMRRIAETDCEHLSCESCRYCASVAEKVVRIGGAPPSRYHPPAAVPPSFRVLPSFGGAPAPAKDRLEMRAR